MLMKGISSKKTLQLEFTDPNVIEQKIYNIVKPPQTRDFDHLEVVYYYIIHANERYHSKVHYILAGGCVFHCCIIAVASSRVFSKKIEGVCLRPSVPTYF